MRLDLYLIEHGFYKTRQKAKEAIISERVCVDGVLITKPSYDCLQGCHIDAKPFEFVSRGGFKLQKAIEEFCINMQDKVVLDIGASTGGFTDVSLQNGAKKVYAVDTGEGQLAEQLLNDTRVLNLEKTNYLNVQKAYLNDVDIVVIDVSFVSLTKLAPKLADDFVNENFNGKHIDVIALIKPQFEVGFEYAKKHKGIVVDKKIHKKVVDNVVFVFENFGFHKNGLIDSPIKGGEGNTEFLAWFSN